MMDNEKQKDFYAVVSAIVKFIEDADRGAKNITVKKEPYKERNGLIENRK